jgi:predicted NAD/FAD-dependent oxidoreductase
MKIAIIGAGPAGLTAAQTLIAHGIAPVVFEKSGGLGGRCATRRTDVGLFNHGAPRAHRLPTALENRLTPDRDGFRADPGMSAIGKILAHRVDVRSRTTVDALERNGTQWRVAGENFDALLLSIPAPQAAALCDGLEFAEPLASVEMSAQLTAMVAYDTPQSGTPTQDVTVEPMSADNKRFVLHASSFVTERYLDEEKPAIAQRLATLFSPETPRFASGHRWRYARTKTPLGQPCLHDPKLGLALCGDWCLGPDVGDAIRSGRSAAEALIDATGA